MVTQHEVVGTAPDTVILEFPLTPGFPLKKLSIIAVKSPPGFAAEPSGSHVFLQQGASAILRIA
jgi:hypothetical protein